MAKALANDLRQRVIEVIDGGLSCRQATERFGVSVSSAIRWLDRLKKQGDVAAKRQGGDRKSGRIEAEASFLLGEVAETPDITLVELQEKLQARGVSAGIGTLWRFYARRCITFKKETAHAAEQQRGDVKPFDRLRSSRGVVREVARS